MKYIELTERLDKEIFNGELPINAFAQHNRYIDLVNEIRSTCDKNEAYEIELARNGKEIAEKRIHVLFEIPLQEKL